MNYLQNFKNVYGNGKMIANSEMTRLVIGPVVVRSCLPSFRLVFGFFTILANRARKNLNMNNSIHSICIGLAVRLIR